MLYKTIYFVALSIYATLPRKIFGATYIEYAKQPSNNIGSCSSAQPSDQCIFHCDKPDGKQSFDCYDAGICNIFCEEKKCLQRGTLNATNSLQLNVYALNEHCYSESTLYLPSHGNANISATAEAKTPFTSSIINAGTNTNEVYINCYTIGFCNGIQINAQTARFLHIDAEGYTLSEEKHPITINCPQNSLYNGMYDAECYINAANGGSIAAIINIKDGECYIDIRNGALVSSIINIRNGSCVINATGVGALNDVMIDTLWGYPHDILIDIDDVNNLAATLRSSQMDCNEAKNADILDPETNQCWNTRHPTITPSLSPSLSPSISPSLSPSISPSLSPTFFKLIFPSKPLSHSINRDEASANKKSKIDVMLWVSMAVMFCGCIVFCFGCYTWERSRKERNKLVIAKMQDTSFERQHRKTNDVPPTTDDVIQQYIEPLEDDDDNRIELHHSKKSTIEDIQLKSSEKSSGLLLNENCVSGEGNVAILKEAEPYKGSGDSGETPGHGDDESRAIFD